MKYIFDNQYNHLEDNELIVKALNGSKDALTKLIEKHQNYIYNIAFKMVLSPYDAEDITQEIIIKIITKLSQFKMESTFRTYVYRITVNYCLSMKKKWLEERYLSFEYYEKDLDNISMNNMLESEQLEYKELIEEARIGCLSGMLLCLSRDQRIVFILGEIFSVPHNVGAEIMMISKDNFRQRLCRARADLYRFMDKKCGLVNQNNPCRCHKKMKGFIKEGWVDPNNLKFNINYVKKIYEIVPSKDIILKQVENLDYQNLQKEYPFQEKEFVVKYFDRILNSKTIKDLFNL